MIGRIMNEEELNEYKKDGFTSVKIISSLLQILQKFSAIIIFLYKILKLILGILLNLINQKCKVGILGRF